MTDVGERVTSTFEQNLAAVLELSHRINAHPELAFEEHETSAAIIVLAPILAPVAQHFGIDPVHFGLIMVVNLALGMITPPFGVNLFAACTVAGIPLQAIVHRLVPFVLVVIGCLIVVTYVPMLSLGLRDLVYAPLPAGPAIGPAIGPQ